MLGCAMTVTDTTACHCKHTNIWKPITAYYWYDINVEMSFISSIFIG